METTLNRATVMRALSEAMRWGILAQLSDGSPQAVTTIAGKIGAVPDLVSKHLKVLREAGVVTVARDAGNDARRQLYQVPAPFVTTSGVLDFGFCLLRFG